MMSFKKIMIVDGGTKGCQIAFQIAFSGFDVALYETNPKDIQSIIKKIYQISINSK